MKRTSPTYQHQSAPQAAQTRHIGFVSWNNQAWSQPACGYPCRHLVAHPTSTGWTIRQTFGMAALGSCVCNIYIEEVGFALAMKTTGCFSGSSDAPYRFCPMEQPALEPAGLRVSLPAFGATSSFDGLDHWPNLRLPAPIRNRGLLAIIGWVRQKYNVKVGNLAVYGRVPMGILASERLQPLESMFLIRNTKNAPLF